MIKEAVFVSVWDEHSRQKQEIKSRCKVDFDTKEVFDIETVNTDELDLEILSREYIIIDGNEYPVLQADERTNNTEYWHF